VSEAQVLGSPEGLHLLPHDPFLFHGAYIAFGVSGVNREVVYAGYYVI
jgi:hypothetical protein